MARKFATSGGLTVEEAVEFAGYETEGGVSSVVSALRIAGYLEDAGTTRPGLWDRPEPVLRITRDGLAALDTAMAKERADG